ncbi:MAG: NADH-quinone oxidoreductase subunit L [Candidatus Tectomicrobia bacterium]|nr:NADH-quinone oxidoreductase subunit L [Candidatus Tectomicrobia bacterium]
MKLLVWLIPLFPALGALINGLLGRRFTRERAHLIAVGSVGLSLLLALIVIIRTIFNPSEPIHAKLYTWVFAGEFSADMALLVDPLSAIMLFVVCGVGFLVHVYSVGYMHGDEGYPRFFTYLNLFMMSMLILVLADNYLLMFVGWEGVGLCSYLLIGFWYDRQSASDAGKKAFLVNRIGDAGFMLAVFLIFWSTHSLNYETVFHHVHEHPISTGLATAITLLLFVGAMGKSAQVPLYVWLPDAMEGPTPVSALIHAATMVTAGVYMVVRSQALFVLAPATMTVVAAVGAFTAIFAASIGLVQNDIKRVLAYSTVSQLGYMFLACGVGAFASGLFHVMTHAFFKGLLFLGAGSVIHAMHEEQDMRNMGGLHKHIPGTYRTMLWATIAIAGIPPLAGFWSKDEILTSAIKGGGLNYLWWVMGMCAAFMTSFYMFRLLFMTFYGQERFDTDHVHPHESPPSMLSPLKILAVLSIIGGFIVGIPPENGLFHRFLAHAFADHGGAHHAFHWWPDFFLMIVSSLVALAGLVTAYYLYLSNPQAREGLVARISSAVGVLLNAVRNTGAPEAFYTERTDQLATKYAFAHQTLLNKYYVDEFYYAYVVRPIMWLMDKLWGFDGTIVDGMVNGVGKFTRLYSNWSGLVDRFVVDGSVNGVGVLVRSGSQMFRLVQTGIVQNYLLVMALGVFVFTTIYLIF